MIGVLMCACSFPSCVCSAGRERLGMVFAEYLESEASQLLVWGLFSRLLGLIYGFAIVQLIPQLALNAGSRGIAPARLRLERIRKDYPSLLFRLRAYPTYLWLDGGTDAFMYALLALGTLSSLAVVVGGSYTLFGVTLDSRLALFTSWSVYLSFRMVMELWFPWDQLLCEVGFLSLFLAPLPPLLGFSGGGLGGAGLVVHLGATARPGPALAFAFRWLLFRVTFGFGKLKFHKAKYAPSSCFFHRHAIGPHALPFIYVCVRCLFQVV
jgi:hypothetical protein